MADPLPSFALVQVVKACMDRRVFPDGRGLIMSGLILSNAAQNTFLAATINALGRSGFYGRTQHFIDVLFAIVHVSDYIVHLVFRGIERDNDVEEGMSMNFSLVYDLTDADRAATYVHEFKNEDDIVMFEQWYLAKLADWPAEVSLTFRVQHDVRGFSEEEWGVMKWLLMLDELAKGEEFVAEGRKDFLLLAHNYDVARVRDPGFEFELELQPARIYYMHESPDLSQLAVDEFRATPPAAGGKKKPRPASRKRSKTPSRRSRRSKSKRKSKPKHRRATSKRARRRI